MIKNEKELTMNFSRDKIIGKMFSVMHYHWRMVMEKNISWLPKFDWLNREKYICVHILREYANALSLPNINGHE